MAAHESWVTTVDNPFDPFVDYDNWQRYDEDKGYYTTSLLCRLLNVSTEYDDEAYQECVDAAVDAIVRLNPNGMYRKVVR